MNKSRLDLPHIKLLIAHRVANGYSQREIAQELKTSQPTISRIVKRDDTRELILEEEICLYRQEYETLEKIRHDPRFMAELQNKLEKELLNIKRW